MKGTERLSQSLEGFASHLVSNAALGIANKRPDFLMRALEPIINKFPAGFYCTEIETGNIVYASRTFMEIVGHKSIQDMNESLRQNKLYDDPNQRNGWLKTLLTNGDSLKQHRLTLLKHVPNGKPIPVFVEDTAFLVRNRNNPKYVVGFIQDVTDKVIMEKELEKKAFIDPLTQLQNRRYYEERLDADITLWRQKELPVSILMLDIDHFKLWNDQKSHEAGDNILRQLGLQIKSFLGVDDIAIRYGGEEILIALPVDTDIAQKIAERLRGGIETFGKSPQKAVLEDGSTLTVSVGVASGNDSLRELTCKADAALYASKQQGRNRVTVYDESMKKVEK